MTFKCCGPKKERGKKETQIQTEARTVTVKKQNVLLFLSTLGQAL